MKKIPFVCSTAILLLAACSNFSNPSDSLPAMPTPTSFPGGKTAMPTDDRAALVEAELSPDGPWLIFAATDGIFAVNADGSGPFLIAPPPMNSFAALTFDLPAGLSPASPYLALRMDDADGRGWDIKILRLPDLTVVFSAPLLSPENFPQDMQMGDLNPDLVQGITDPNALSWSPGGRYLAFIAALDSPSTDLYLYDTELEAVTRLSSGELHVATPVWSRDGERVIYQVVETFGSGAGWVSKSFYSVTLDGETSKLLARLPQSAGPALVLGMTQDDLMLVDIFSQQNIPALQWIDLNLGGLVPLSSGRILMADVDPMSGAYAYVDGNGQLYYSSRLTGTPEMIDAGPWLKIIWSPIASEFFIIGKDRVSLLFAVMDDYLLSPAFEQGGNLTRSPDGNMLCLAGDDLYCESMRWDVQVGQYPDAFVLWDPSSTGIFFVSGSDLYYAPVPGFHPVLVDSNLMPVQYVEKTLTPFYIGWVGQ